MNVVEADGTSIGACRIHVMTFWTLVNQVIHCSQEADSDSEGNLHVTLPGTMAGVSAATVELRRWRGAVGCRDSYDRARIVLDSAFPAGIHDLGRVFLDAPPLVLAGTVVDELGDPCPGVSVQAARPESWSPMEYDCDYPEDLVAPAGLSLSTDARGRFELRGWAEDPSVYRILLRKPDADTPDPTWSRPEPSMFPWGETNWPLVLPRSASLAGRLILDARVDTRDVYVYVAHGPRLASVQQPRWDLAFLPAETHRDETQVNLSPDGTFRTEGLQPGPCTVRIRVHGVPGDLLRLEEVELIPGRTNTDPRLQDLALQALWRIVDVTAVDSRDHAVPGARAWILADDVESESGWVGSRESGTMQIVTRPRSLTLDLTAPGFRAVRLKEVDGDRRVRLEPGIPVRLVLDPTLEHEYGGPASLDLTRIASLDGSPDDSPSGARGERGGESHLVGSGELFFADTPGVYALTWPTWGGGDFPVWSLGEAAPSTISIEDTVEPQTFVIGIAR